MALGAAMGRPNSLDEVARRARRIGRFLEGTVETGVGMWPSFSIRIASKKSFGLQDISRALGTELTQWSQTLGSDGKFVYGVSGLLGYGEGVRESVVETRAAQERAEELQDVLRYSSSLAEEREDRERTSELGGSLPAGNLPSGIQARNGGSDRNASDPQSEREISRMMDSPEGRQELARAMMGERLSARNDALGMGSQAYADGVQAGIETLGPPQGVVATLDRQEHLRQAIRNQQAIFIASQGAWNGEPNQNGNVYPSGNITMASEPSRVIHRHYVSPGTGVSEAFAAALNATNPDTAGHDDRVDAVGAATGMAVRAAARNEPAGFCYGYRILGCNGGAGFCYDIMGAGKGFSRAFATREEAVKAAEAEIKGLPAEPTEMDVQEAIREALEKSCGEDEDFG